jgi:hypothetical protein
MFFAPYHEIVEVRIDPDRRLTALLALSLRSVKLKLQFLAGERTQLASILWLHQLYDPECIMTILSG